MSNAFDKASLVMLPHAYEEGKVYSLKPTDRSGDFTFSRGADTATRVNEQGYIEKEHSNLLLQSNNFDTSPWLLSSTLTATPGELGYDGSNDAWKITKNSIGQFFYQNNSFSNELLTFSIYAKAGDSDWVRFFFIGNNAEVFFDLSTPTGGIGFNRFLVDSSITPVGSGWFRISVTTSTSSSAWRIYPAEADSDTSGTSGSIYVQDAQINQGLVVTPYLETTTAPVFGGLTDNMPRLDYTDATCPSLLLEPSRTNLITNSEFRSGGTNSSVFNNSTSSPEGVSNACLFVENTALNVHGIQFSNTIPTNASAVDYTISVFAKAKEREHIQLSFFADSVSNNSSFFDIANGTTSGDASTHKIEDYGNGWYRCSFTSNVSQTTGTYNLVRFVMSTGSSGYYTGDGTSGLYMYGLQVEAGSYPTSYIPTYGSAQTRPADLATDAGNATTFNDSEGVLFFEGSALANVNTGYNFLSIAGASVISDRITIGFSSKKIFAEIKRNNITEMVYSKSADISEVSKLAIKYKENDCKFYINGVLEHSDTSVSLPSNLQQLNFSSPSAFKFYGNTNQVLYFPTALSDEECIALTQN